MRSPPDVLSGLPLRQSSEGDLVADSFPKDRLKAGTAGPPAGTHRKEAQHDRC